MALLYQKARVRYESFESRVKKNYQCGKYCALMLILRSSGVGRMFGNGY